MTSEEAKYRNIIAKHEEDIRRWHRMIKDANVAIEHNEGRILSLQGKTYYVYFVFVDGNLKYIGKGKKDRYKHPISGASSCSELNRDHFAGSCIEVRIAAKNLIESKALSMEEEYLYSFNLGNGNLYNKNIPDKLKEYQIFWDCCDSMAYHRLSSHICANKEKEDLVVPDWVEWAYD